MCGEPWLPISQRNIFKKVTDTLVLEGVSKKYIKVYKINNWKEEEEEKNIWSKWASHKLKWEEATDKIINIYTCISYYLSISCIKKVQII